MVRKQSTKKKDAGTAVKRDQGFKVPAKTLKTTTQAVAPKHTAVVEKSLQEETVSKQQAEAKAKKDKKKQTKQQKKNGGEVSAVPVAVQEEKEEEEEEKSTSKKNKKATVSFDGDEDMIPLDDDGDDMIPLNVDDDDEAAGEEAELTEEQLASLDSIAQRVKSKLTSSDDNDEERGVVYLGHLPHGFFEPQLTGFFHQFGELRKVFLVRNKKTMKSRHFAFVEFGSKEVAGIVADTMNRYMLFGRTLVCQLLTEERARAVKFPSSTVIKADVRVVAPPQDAGQKKALKARLKAQEAHNKIRTVDEQNTRVNRLLSKEKQKRARLAAVGVQYDFPGYAAVAPPVPKRKKL